MRNLDAGEWSLTDCEEKKYDAKQTASFSDDLARDFQDYHDRAKDLEAGYGRYYNNTTYVGSTADASKEFIGTRQTEEIHYENLDIQKEFIGAVGYIEDAFKQMVDPSPNAKIDSVVVKEIKHEQQAFSRVFDEEGYALERWTQRMVDKFGRFGVSTLPSCSVIRERYEELSGPGGHLDKCNKRLKEFDDFSLNYLNQSGIKERNYQLQNLIKNTASGLDSFTVYQPTMTKNSVSVVALNMVSPFSRLYGFSKDYSSESVYSDDVIIKTLKDQYGFTDDQAKLINDAYKQYEKKHNNGILKKTSTEKINEFFSNLAALNNGYGTNIDVELDFKIKFTNPKDLLKHPEKILIGESVENFDYNIKGNFEKNKKNFTPFNMLGTNPSTEKAIKFFDDLGVDGNELKKALDEQHRNCKDNEKRDFVHECAMFAVMSDDGFRKQGGDFFDDVNAAIGYKGDVYSGEMGIDDIKSDVEAYNAYYRMEKASYGKIWDALTRYNKGVEDGSINGSKEFLEHFGDGDAEKGMEKLKEDLDTATPITNIISKNKDTESINECKKKFLDYISKESGVDYN